MFFCRVSYTCDLLSFNYFNDNTATHHLSPIPLDTKFSEFYMNEYVKRSNHTFPSVEQFDKRFLVNQAQSQDSIVSLSVPELSLDSSLSLNMPNSIS